MTFNETVGVDCFEFKDCGYKKFLLNCLCWGTGFQMACIITDEQSPTVRNAFADTWVKHYGWPQLLITDQGTEFTGRAFADYVGQYGCLHHFIDSQSPWQQGRTERAGAHLKECMRDVVEELGLVTDEDFELCLAQSLDAKNRYVNRSGFSAHQRVFGSSRTARVHHLQGRQ